MYVNHYICMCVNPCICMSPLSLLPSSASPSKYAMNDLNDRHASLLLSSSRVDSMTFGSQNEECTIPDGMTWQHALPIIAWSDPQRCMKTCTTHTHTHMLRTFK